MELKRLQWLLLAKDLIKASFYIPENRLSFPTTKGFRIQISMKLVYQYVTISIHF